LNSRFVLDSWALIALLNKEQPASEQVEKILRMATDGHVYLVLSIINLGEIYYIVGRNRGSNAADEFLAELKRLPIQIIPANEQHVLAAAQLKMTHPIAYADAFTAAAAIELDATLLTGDPEFLNLGKKIKIQHLHRNKKR